MAMISGMTRLTLLFLGVPVTLALLYGASLWPLLIAYGAWVGLMFWGARRGKQISGVKRTNLAGLAFMLFLIFGLPVALASVVAKTWLAIVLAYGLWFGLLGLWIAQGLTSRRVTNGEAVGWPMIGAMFLTMVAVPLLTFLFRILSLA